MKKKPNPLLYFVLGIALVALSNSSSLLMTSDPVGTEESIRSGIVVWSFIGIIGDIFIFIVTPIQLYKWYKERKNNKKEA